MRPRHGGGREGTYVHPLAVICVAALLASACSLEAFEPTVGGPTDAGRMDAGSGDVDGGRSDAGADDAGADDAGTVDAGSSGDSGADAGTTGDDAGSCTPDICDGVDNDCDPGTADGSDDSRVGAACDGPDDDLCEEGTTQCSAGAIVCDDTTGDASETCNAMDDDCDGTIDEGAGCPCELRYRGTEPYLFCTMRRSWGSADTFCRGRGYSLVTIVDAAEQSWVYTTGSSIRAGEDWYIGLQDFDGDGTWEWTSGSTATFLSWDAGEPSGEGPCADLEAGAGGRWRDERCSLNEAFICDRD